MSASPTPAERKAAAPEAHAAPAGHAPSPDAIELPPTPTPSRARVVASAVAVVVFFALLFAAGLTPRVLAARELRSAASEVSTAIARVPVVHPRQAAPENAAVLPGSVEPLRRTWLYARANGYVRQWLVDIGDEVQEGQLLLDLDTPELDAELIQAKANVAQAQTTVDQAAASRELARITDSRYEKLGPSGVASQQDVEDKRTQLAVAEANVRAAKAALDSQNAAVSRLNYLKAFSRLVAPFSGRITARNVEKGQLVNAGNSGGQGLFELAQVDTVRVFVHVPQDFAPQIRLDEPVAVRVRELPDRTFTGKVTHTAGALDPASRSLNTEIQIPNHDQALLAGMYVQVQIDLAGGKPTLRVPAAALLSDSRGTRLMTVDGSSHLKSLPVRVGRDLGSEIEVLEGLKGDENVVTLIPEGATDGMQVEVIPPAPARS